MKVTGHADGGSALRIRSIAILGSLLLTGALFLLIIPATAFVSDSLVINIDKSGDATVEFQFTLQGFVENSIPQSMLETEFKKGLTSNSEPPEILSFDREGCDHVVEELRDCK